MTKIVDRRRREKKKKNPRGRNSRDNTKVRAGGGGGSRVGRQWIFHEGQGAPLRIHAGLEEKYEEEGAAKTDMY